MIVLLARLVLAALGMLAFVGLFYEFPPARLLLRDKDGRRLIASRRGCCSVNFTRDWGMFSIGAVSTAVFQLTLSGQVVGGLPQGVGIG